jgi:hypothetical protein
LLGTHGFGHGIEVYGSDGHNARSIGEFKSILKSSLSIKTLPEFEFANLFILQRR